MQLSAEDKEFLIRALGMHAALTMTFGKPGETMMERAENCSAWIRDAADSDMRSIQPRSTGENAPPLPQSN